MKHEQPLSRRRQLQLSGIVAYNPHSIIGVWSHQGQRYEDELFKLTVDVEDQPLSRDFIAHLKAELLERFDQLEIYIVAYPIEVF